jgi:hypothetical protein
MKTYLSIDLDFFNNTPIEQTESILETIIKKAIKKKIPIVSVMNHQQLLPRVNKYFKTGGHLINVDWHSDICSVKKLVELNCGTWISYVNKRKLCSFSWYHPTGKNDYRVVDGSCQEDSFKEMVEHGKLWRYGTDWNKVSGKGFRVEKVPELVKNNVCEIGLCMSPGWSNKKAMDLFNRLIKKYKIPFRKGIYNEYDNYVIKKLPRGY